MNRVCAGEGTEVGIEVGMANEDTGDIATRIEVLVERNDTEEGVIGLTRHHDRGQDHRREERGKSNRVVTVPGVKKENVVTIRSADIVITAAQDPQMGEDGTDGLVEVFHHLSSIADSLMMLEPISILLRDLPW